MMSLGKFLFTWGSIAGFLVYSFGGAITVAAELLPLASFTAQGEVKSGAPREPEVTYLTFHAKFKQVREGEEPIAGICDLSECGPSDVTINTKVYSALWPFETLKDTIPMLSQDLLIKVVGDCFEDSEQGYVFELREDNEKCVAATVQVMTSSPEVEILDKLGVEVLDMKELLQSMKLQLFPGEDEKQASSRANNQLWGDWFLVSEVKFKNPPFPYPVAGFGGAAGGPSSGTELCIGNQCGSAPFGGISFLGCSGEEICEPIEPDPDPECRTATVDLNLDIHVPEATYKTLVGTSNIWFDLEFKGVDPDKDFVWRLKDFGENK